MEFKGKMYKSKGITLIALIITIIVLLILAGVTIASLTGSDSAPAKANEAKQKQDIGAARDQVYLFATNAQTEAYESVYVKGKKTDGSNEDVTAGGASNQVGAYVRAQIFEEYKASKNKKVGLASIVANENGEITISTTDFTEYGLIDLSGGALAWITPVPITTIGEIIPANPEVGEGREITLSVSINGDATESVIWESDDETIATVVSTGKNTAKVTGVVGQAGEQVKITAKNVDGSISVNKMIKVIEAPIEARTDTSYVGYYAEVNGVWGIIYADLLKQKPDASLSPWGNDNGEWSFSSGISTDSDTYKSYTVSSTIPSGKTTMTETGYTSTGVISQVSGSSGSDRFLVMAMDNESGTYTWGDAFALPQQKNNGWSLPSKEQWSMFGSAFNVTSGNRGSRGLSDCYWSSTEYASDTSNAWRARFSNGRMDYASKTATYVIRLCTTF